MSVTGDPLRIRGEGLRGDCTILAWWSPRNGSSAPRRGPGVKLAAELGDPPAVPLSARLETRTKESMELA